MQDRLNELLGDEEKVRSVFLPHCILVFFPFLFEDLKIWEKKNRLFRAILHQEKNPLKKDKAKLWKSILQVGGLAFSF